MKVRSSISIIVASLALMIVGIIAINAQENSPRVWLSSDLQQVATGQEFTVQINVAEAVGVYGASLKLAYDPQVLEVLPTNNEAVTTGSFFNGQGGFTLINAADAETGILDYAMTLTQPAEPVSGDGLLGTVTFRALVDSEVTITPLEVRLLSPQFNEVNGRKVAESIGEVQAQLEGMTMTVSGSAPITVEQPQVVANDNPQLQAAVNNNPPQPLVLLTVPQSPRMPVLIVGGLLFALGLLLFATSVGAYVNIRRQFRLQEQSEQLIW